MCPYIRSVHTRREREFSGPVISPGGFDTVLVRLESSLAASSLPFFLLFFAGLVSSSS